MRPGTDPVEHWDDKLLFEQDNSTITTDLLTSSSSPVLLLQRVLLQLLQPLLQLLLQPLNPRPTLHLTLPAVAHLHDFACKAHNIGRSFEHVDCRTV